jgi:hypothetical protein
VTNFWSKKFIRMLKELINKWNFFKIKRFLNYSTYCCLYGAEEILMYHTNKEWINYWQVLLYVISKKLNLKLKMINMKTFYKSNLFRVIVGYGKIIYFLTQLNMQKVTFFQCFKKSYKSKAICIKRKLI